MYSIICTNIKDIKVLHILHDLQVIGLLLSYEDSISGQEDNTVHVILYKTRLDWHNNVSNRMINLLVL